MHAVAFNADEGFAAEGSFYDDGDVFAGFDGGFVGLKGDAGAFVP